MLSAKILRRVAGAILAAAISTPTMAQQPEQYFPVASMRVGPYNAMGTGIFGGVIDYLNYVNIKHGGVNGVKLVYEECETEYNAARSVECYQRLLNRGARLTELLKQPQFQPLPFEEQVASIFAGVNGYLDGIPAKDVTRFEAAFLAEMRSKHGKVLTDIRESKDLSADSTSALKSALEAFVKTFA